MKITDIRIGKVQIPLKQPFKTALRRVELAEDVVVKILCDDGSVGYGSAPATAVITGDSHESVIAAVRHTIGPQLVGRDIDDREDILQAVQRSMVHNTSAKAAVDMAVYDLFGQRCRMASVPIVRRREAAYCFRFNDQRQCAGNDGGRCALRRCRRVQAAESEGRSGR